MFFQKTKRFARLLEIQKELYMWGAFRTLLQLSNHISGIGLQEPLLQIVARLHLGIVQGTQKIIALILTHIFLFN